ncbi:Protein Gp5, N-terminal OB-fold domain containing protein [uncultured Caudovirales phage]|uniref:Protein Gp5, N-terminal OB-fold domain containing protein n=1 Tax=uncultured Caudovirales phage TaxID=2100421 RepID=A0A6J5M3H5_9CAUD|nr:Protein Gp5, N-terminal OB-fold domain containing protein [uncultured Caudovirales phage]
MQYSFFGKDGFIWWKGVVEDRKDPIFLGRVRVRIFGWHTDDLTQLPTADLPWAVPSLPLDNGRNSVGPKEGDWCWGFFMDGQEAQKPVVVGFIPGIDEIPSDPNRGFGDPTNPDELVPGSTPRPPNMGRQRLRFSEPTISRVSFLRYIAKLDPPTEIRDGLNRLTDALFLNKPSIKIISELPSGLSNVVNEISQIQNEITEEVRKQINSAIQFVFSKITELADLVKSEISSAVDSTVESVSRFADENVLPGTNLAFGELANGVSLANFDILKSKFDVNKDGQFTEDDVISLIEDAISDGGFFDGYIDSIAELPMSTYPLVDRLNEPSTSRLERNENIEKTIVELKKKKLIPGEGAGFAGSTVGGKVDSPTTFMEPPTPYAAQYPYNHVYESESGHVTEIDDTPGAERLHWYHKSGTFREMHPNGVQVSKTVNSEYNIIYGDYYNSTDLTYHVDAKKGIRMKSSANFNIQTTDSLNNQVGSNLNYLVGENSTYHIGGNDTFRVDGNSNRIVSGSSNTLVTKTKTRVVGESDWLNVAEGVYINCSGGPVQIFAEKEVSIWSATRVQLSAVEGIDLVAPEVNIQTGVSSTFGKSGLDVGLGLGNISTGNIGCFSISSVFDDTVVGSAFASFTATRINSLYCNSNLFTGNYVGNFAGNAALVGTFSPGAAFVPLEQIPPFDTPPVYTPPMATVPILSPNIADKPPIQTDILNILQSSIVSADGSPKYGFFIPNGVIGDVYKPVSDSNGNLVTLSALGPNHQLCEAIPTPVLEKVLIKYEAPDGKITQWEVIRPVHVPGKILDTPQKVDMFEDGIRHLVRWSKPGREYPKQLFWIVNGKPMLILDSAERHQCKFGPYNDKL